MSLLSTVGKKSLEVKLIVVMIYILLMIGGITMVYPFLIMISGSFKGGVDINDYDTIPKYFYNYDVLFRRYLESKYNESLTNYNINARQDEFSFEKIKRPDKLHSNRLSDWQEFIKDVEIPATYSVLGHSIAVGKLPENARGYRQWIQKESEGSLETYNERFDAHIGSWLQISLPKIETDKRKFKLTGSKIEKAFLEYKSRQPFHHLYYFSLDGKYVQDFLYYKYGKKIEDYNQVHNTDYKSYSEVFLLRKCPESEKEKGNWLEFVHNELNLQFIQISKEANGEWAEFLKKRYESNTSLLNKAYGTYYTSFAEVPYPEDVLHTSEKLVDWELFIFEVSPEYITLTGPEFLWRDFLKNKYRGDISGLNSLHESNYDSFEKIPMPTKEIDWYDMKKNCRQLRMEFATRNYKMAIQYLFLHGRGMLNTFILCALSILIALIVNPVAAYAMSRYNLPSTYKLLLYFMAIMAFPSIVTTIPNFLLLKELGLLNTFWALVLPGMVNGYMVFLLKGFFDSLPKELYETAMIDGASEWTIFWKITMTLSTPILAVIALGAFTSAYGAFMFAFIVCQNEKMWTLMVWLYQLQQFSHQSVTFASLILAAIPTFLIFIFCQNIIMRGIVVPIER